MPSLRPRQLPDIGGDRRQSGLTLIELVVVLVILAAIAGLVMPAVGALGRSTDMAVSGDCQSQLSGNLQQFFVLQKRYPQGMDSLLQDGTGGAAGDGTPDGLYVNVSFNGSQVSGMTTSNPNLLGALEMTTLSTQQVRSITRAGLEYVFDHHTYDASVPQGEVNANNSGKFRRALTSANTQSWAVLRIPANDTGSANQSTMDLLQRLVPAEITGTAATPGTRVYTPEAGTRLVAFGIGPNCKLVPTTMLNVPLYPGADGTYYGRYIAIFKVYETGERMTLVGVTDAYGRTPDYTQQQFNESLPNGGRQG